MYCRHCGSYLPAGSSHCPRCGVALEPQRVVPLYDQADVVTRISVPRSPTAERNYWPLIAGILAALVLVMGGLWVYTSINNTGAGEPTVEREKAEARKQQTVATEQHTAAREPLPAPTQPVSSNPPVTALSTYPPAVVTKYIHPTYQVWHYRIKFQPGHFGGVVRDSLPKLNRYYTVSGRAGQTIQVSLTSPTEAANFFVSRTEGGQESISPGEVYGSWQGTLPVTGDYTIYVNRGYEMKGASMPFELLVSLR